MVGKQHWLRQWLPAVITVAVMSPLLGSAQNVDVYIRETARLRADVAGLREENAKLVGRLQENQALIQELGKAVRRLSERAATQETGDSGADLKRQLKALADALATERAAREKADQEMIRTLTEELRRVISRPPTTGGTTPGTTGGTTDVGSQGTYTVVRGDTLGAIAQAFNISVKQLKKANELADDLIREGQTLVIPKP